MRFLTNVTWARIMMSVLPDLEGHWATRPSSTSPRSTAINPTLYEAARIDGASRFQQVRQITLPLLAPTMKVVLMLNVLGLLRIFDQIYVMRNGVVQRKVDVLMTYVYDMGILKYEVGYASAVSVMVLVATLAMTAVVWYFTGFGRRRPDMRR